MRFLFQNQQACRLLRPYLQLPKRYQTSSVIQDSLSLKTGDNIHGYLVQKVVPVQELQCVAVQLQHEQTGAEHLHIARDDQNNMFGVMLRTTPMDSTGVPHILEHTALCGSKKFPVRDPFFKMLTRSLSTFMNAFTASDWTMYPFTTQNRKDYENLLSVYLDAVFHPNLRQADFSQEGWRLEHENPEDNTSPITFKGVVFNEMKGVFSSSQSLFLSKLQRMLLPNHTYGVESGGDPICIPDLTWEQLKSFHASHYHPSNSRFFTYGDFPLEMHLKLIAEELKDFKKINPNTEVPLEQQWETPRECTITCKPDPMAADPEKQTTLAVSFMLGDITDRFEADTQSFIGSLLVDGETCPFYQALIEPNIGSDYSPGTGCSNYTRNGYFSVGLQNIRSEDIERVKNLIEDTIDRVIKDGFDSKNVEALLHKIELSLKHQTDNFGLHLAVSLSCLWNHGGSPSEALQINAFMDRLKQCMKENPRFLQDKVKQYFKDNPHRLTLIMQPDEKYDEQIKMQERQKLEDKLANLTEQDKKDIYENGLKLKAEQMKAVDASCLPTLQISDIEEDLKRYAVNEVYQSEVPVQYCEQPTNGVTYFRAVSNMAHLSEELKPYVPLFCNIVTRMGAGAMDYMELSQQMSLKTGGMDACSHVTGDPSDIYTYEQGILFSSYCLDKNTESMYELWTEIFNRLNLQDTNHLITLIRMEAANMANGLVHSGHSYAMQHASSSLLPSTRLTETLSGITQVSMMKRLAELEDMDHVVDNLNRIANHVLDKNNLRVAVNVSPESSAQVMMSTESFLTSLPVLSKTRDNDILVKDTIFSAKPDKNHFELPFSVNFAAQSVPTVPFNHPDFAKLQVLAKLMSSKYLHREIREKGGAYGGGATSNTPGVFQFFSYRDPRSLETLEVFDQSMSWAKAGEYSQQDVEESILGVFQQVDKPVAPGKRGLPLFLGHLTDDMRKEHRDQLKKCTKDQMVEVANRYFQSSGDTSVTLLGPHNPAVEEDSSWKVRKETSQ
ncbi:presequence protease, mitochondrial [Lingula anatina]|uniref:Presequence protease, mitochondrial n=1 Tax=Lingula anatina TaxID=7574 RepID=A0A1S3J7K7_LINAN|nr:presequence protease, mitochondrial [Lingula anatina]|eukprot:XP_013406216.1 presequence protease, mitochondrial [Lingula anatina]